MKKIYLYGAGGHARVIADALELQERLIAGLFDDNENIESDTQYPLLGPYQPGSISHSDEIIISVGNNRIRKNLVQKMEVNYGIAIHPSAVLSPCLSLGAGSVVMAGAVINWGTQIGSHVIINTLSSVDHDCFIGDFGHISPHAALAGNVQVGEGSHIGIGACVIPGIRIGKWCTIGAGSVIIRDVPDGSTVVGNPGRIIKTNHDFV